MRSSYAKNNYDNVFRSIVLTKEPKIVIEAGILDGYSTYNISHALRFNSYHKGIESKFLAFDLFEDYEYNHGNYDEVKNMLNKQGLDKYCNIIKGDIFDFVDMFNDIDLLHVDISNTGDTLIKVIEVFGDKMSKNGMIIFEGGSLERDNIEWMKKYNKKSIRNELINNPFVYENWNIQILTPFPSITLLWKKI